MKLFLKECQKFYIEMLSLLYLKVLSSIDIVKWPEFSPMRSVKHWLHNKCTLLLSFLKEYMILEILCELDFLQLSC